MVNQNQVIVFVISFLIAGFFLVSKPEVGFSGPSIPGGPPCCFDPNGEVDVCIGGADAELVCNACINDTQPELCTFYNDRICVGESGGAGACVAQIPTFSQWGKIMTIVVIGLFAVIGIIVMRQRSRAVTN